MSGRHQPANGSDSAEGLGGLVGFAEREAMDRYLDNLESLLTAIAQRRMMTSEQVRRFGRLLGTADRAILQRGYEHGIERK